MNKYISNIQTGEEVYEEFSDYVLENFRMNDKTIAEWHKYFYVEIPSDNLTPETCKKLDARIARLYQEASYFHSLCTTESYLLERSSSSDYREKYNEIVEDWKQKQEGKLPAAATLETLAKHSQDDMLSAIAKAEIAKEFWKNILRMLDVCRKLVDNATFNSNIESKLMKEEL